MNGPNPNRQKLICKDCSTEIFADINMVIVKDKLWNRICDHHDDALCDKCMEKRMGRPITENDFKKSGTSYFNMIPCNDFWLRNKNKTTNA